MIPSLNSMSWDKMAILDPKQILNPMMILTPALILTPTLIPGPMPIQMYPKAIRRIR